MRHASSIAERCRRRVRGPAVLLLLACVSGACRERPGEIALPPLPERVDPTLDASVLPDGAIPCRRDSDCDDEVACSRDVCAPGGFCVSSADSSRCTDGVYCNGQEVCDPAFGCRPGAPRRCSDEDVCTIDHCDEANKRCAHDPRDFDDDGEIDWHCLGGTDCDDFDATRANAHSEICADGVDNDCDDVVDELSCGRVEHDRCEDALDISAGGRFQVQVLGAAPDYALSCSAPGSRDVAFTFTTDKAHDVTLVAAGVLVDGSDETATIALRSNCQDVQSEIECNHGFPGQVRVRALPPGRYFVIASSQQAARVVVEARFADPTEAPTNQTCESPLEVSAGGRFEGDFVDVGDEADLACGFPNAADLVYRFTTQAEHDVELSAISLSGSERMSFAVRTVCDEPESTLRCLSNAPARARLHQLPAGTYYVVLEGSNAREVDFSLDLAFLDPTPPPAGDSCAEPLELELETLVTGTLANRQDLVSVQECGCKPEDAPRGCELFLPNAVYRVQVEAPTDLALEIDSPFANIAYDFRSVCDASAAQLSCGKTAATHRERIRNLSAGDYFLIVESADPAGFSVELQPLPRTMPVPVGGNDTCATAVDIPADGGLFSGDTLGMINDYEATCGSGARSSDATFRVVLTQTSRVVASLEAVFDTVLYRYRDGGQGPLVCAERGVDCNDDGGSGSLNSLLDETLEPGNYYYVVDGFNENNQGRYLLDVNIGPP